MTTALEAAACVEIAAGASAAAEGHYRSAHALLEVDTMPGALAGIAGNLACLLGATGDPEEALRLAHSARANAPRTADDFYSEVTWRSALSLVNAREGRADEGVRLSDEAVARVADSDVLLFRGKTFEEAAVVRHLIHDQDGEARMLRLALQDYERKGSIVGAERVRAQLEATA